MGDQLELAAHGEVRQGGSVEAARRQLPFNRHHRQEGRPKAALDGVLDRLERVELHLDLQPRHIKAGASQKLVHHLAGGGLGIQTNEAQPIEVVLAEFRQARQGVLGGKHQGELIAGVGHHLQQLVEVGRQFAADDRQVDLAVGHAPARAPGAVHLQLHRHLRILLAEQADHARHQIGAGGLAGADDQGAAAQVVQIIESSAGLLALAEDPIAVAQQQVACFGELRLAATPVEQGDIQLLLQVLDLETHRRLRHIQAVCRLLETALAGDGPQDAQLVEGEGQVSHEGQPWGIAGRSPARAMNFRSRPRDWAGGLKADPFRHNRPTPAPPAWTPPTLTTAAG